MENILIENYLETLYLNEDFSSIIQRVKNINIKSTIDDLKTAIHSKNVEKIGTTLNKINLPDIPAADKALMAEMPKYKESVDLALRVFKNTFPSAKENQLEYLAKLVAIKGNFKSENPMKDTKENILDVTKKIRKRFALMEKAPKEDAEKREMPEGTMLELVIGYSIIIFGWSVLAAITLTVGYIFNSLLAAAIIFSVLFVVKNSWKLWLHGEKDTVQLSNIT